MMGLTAGRMLAHLLSGEPVALSGQELLKAGEKKCEKKVVLKLFHCLLDIGSDNVQNDYNFCPY